MTEGMNEVVGKLDSRIKMLETELKKLKAARDILTHLDITDTNDLFAAKPIHMREAVYKAVEAIGPAKPGPIRDYVLKNFIPNANYNSVRWTLSDGGKEGLFVKVDKKGWKIADQPAEK